MNYVLCPTGVGKASVVRSCDQRAVTHGSMPVRYAQEVCDLLNAAGIEVAPLPAYPPISLAYIDPEMFTEQTRTYHDGIESLCRTIAQLRDAAAVASA